MKFNWIKMYDKGTVLRVETVINNPEEFRVRRRVRRQGRDVMAWVPLRKSVTLLFRYREISAQSSVRYLDALSQVQDPTPAVRDLDALTTNASTKDGRTVRAFNPLSRNERMLFEVLQAEVVGAQAKLFVKDMDTPALVMDDLKSGVQKGQVALAVLTGATYFSNFEIRPTPEAPWQRQLPAMPPGTLTKWSLSPSYDALKRDLERPLSPDESNAIPWQDVAAEPPGVVVFYRYREAPHPRVSFQTDFSKRLEPQPGMKVVYARTTIDSDRDEVKKLSIGYSDDVSVFLNGQILFRGRSAQGFRDPRFLGIISPDDDAVYLPLKKGRNELMLALSELGGGWGFVCRLGDAQD